jgi:hypothetical protein
VTRPGGCGGTVGPLGAAVKPPVMVWPGGGGGTVRPVGAAVESLGVVGPNGGGTTVRSPALCQNRNPGGGTDSSAGMGATLQELSCRKMSKWLVKRGKIAKGKSVS